MPAPAPPPPPPDSPRVDRNLTALAVTSNEARIWPSWPCHSRGLPVLASPVTRPSTSTLEPFLRYSLQASPDLPNTLMRHHRVRSCCWLSWPVHFSLVAMEKLVTEVPVGVMRISGSRPKLPTRMIFWYIVAFLISGAS